MKLTKQHFEAIAETLKETQPMRSNDHEGKLLAEQWRCTVEAFIRLCQRENPRFDVARFIVACGGARFDMVLG